MSTASKKCSRTGHQGKGILNNEESERARRDDVVIRFLPKIRRLARLMLGNRLFNAVITVDDLVDAGVEGLLDAMKRFDSDRGVNFETYAIFRVRGEILEEMRRYDWFSKRSRGVINLFNATRRKLEQTLQRSVDDQEIATFLGINKNDFYRKQIVFHRAMESLDGVLESDNEDGDPNKKVFEVMGLLDIQLLNSEDSLIESIDLSKSKKLLLDMIGRLPSNMRQVINLYYYEEYTMKEIGEKFLKVKESRVSQLHTKAIIRLREMAVKKNSKK